MHQKPFKNTLIISKICVSINGEITPCLGVIKHSLIGTLFLLTLKIHFFEKHGQL